MHIGKRKSDSQAVIEKAQPGVNFDLFGPVEGIFQKRAQSQHLWMFSCIQKNLKLPVDCSEEKYRRTNELMYEQMNMQLE